LVIVAGRGYEKSGGLIGGVGRRKGLEVRGGDGVSTGKEKETPQAFSGLSSQLIYLEKTKGRRREEGRKKRYLDCGKEGSRWRVKGCGPQVLGKGGGGVRALKEDVRSIEREIRAPWDEQYSTREKGISLVVKKRGIRGKTAKMKIPRRKESNGSRFQGKNAIDVGCL